MHLRGEGEGGLGLKIEKFLKICFFFFLKVRFLREEEVGPAVAITTEFRGRVSHRELLVTWSDKQDDSSLPLSMLK